MCVCVCVCVCLRACELLHICREQYVWLVKSEIMYVAYIPHSSLVRIGTLKHTYIINVYTFICFIYIYIYIYIYICVCVCVGI